VSQRYEVIRPSGEGEGVLATDWEINQSGALIFYTVDGAFRTFEIAYAGGQWICFFGADA